MSTHDANGRAERHSLALHLRDLLLSFGPFVALALLLLGLAYWWLDPNPPKHVTLATGPAQSAYDAFGQRYAKALAAYGIQVDLLPSEGSSANLQLLRDGRADVAFVQGGSSDMPAAEQDALSSLGSLFVEPVWVFYRADAARGVNPSGRIDTLSQLNGLRVNVGTPGSGVPALVSKLLEVNHIDPATLRLSHLEQTPATVALLGGNVDALVLVTAPEALIVQMLLQTPGIQLLDFAQSEAYSRRFPFLSPALLPRGVVDLAGDVPAQDVRLIASTTAMLARADTHPALLQLLSQTSLALHGGAGWFNRAHEFPNLAHGELSLAKEAERTLRNGPPLLQRYLPFALANLVERMWLALGIIVALLLPLSRIVPPLYAFRIRSRVFRWYGQLRDLENRITEQPNGQQALVAELNALEQRVEKISVPLSYADELYALRNHIDMVRNKLLR